MEDKHFRVRPEREAVRVLPQLQPAALGDTECANGLLIRSRTQTRIFTRVSERVVFFESSAFSTVFWGNSNPTFLKHARRSISLCNWPEVP